MNVLSIENQYTYFTSVLNKVPQYCANKHYGLSLIIKILFY